LKKGGKSHCEKCFSQTHWEQLFAPFYYPFSKITALSLLLTRNVVNFLSIICLTGGGGAAESGVHPGQSDLPSQAPHPGGGWSSGKWDQDHCQDEWCLL